MKRSMTIAGITMALALMFAAGARAGAEASQPGRVDFGTFQPATNGGQFVEVNLSRTLIALASRLVPKDEAEIAKLLGGLHQVRVNVIGLNDDNRDEITQRMQKVKTTLQEQGWERVVTAQKKAEDVGVYLKTLAEDTIAGLTVVVMDGKKEAVFVNIVGNIQIDQLAVLGERLNIEPLKKLGLPKESSRTTK